MVLPDDPLQVEHLHFLNEAVPSLEKDENDLFRLWAKIPRQFFEEWLDEDFSWSDFYELPPKQHAIILFWSLGLVDAIDQSAKESGNANQAIIEQVIRVQKNSDEFVQNWFHEQSEPTSIEDIKNLKGGPNGSVRFVEFLALLYSMQAQTYALRKHGKYMSELVADVQNGKSEKEESFFLAIRVDPTVLSCSTFARRMSIARMQGDDEFFRLLGNALKTKWRKPKKDLDSLRVILQATLEAGWLNNLSQDESDKLFIQELRAYSDDGNDPARSLQRFINRWKNNK